jgi:hypothetical protein
MFALELQRSRGVRRNAGRVEKSFLAGVLVLTSITSRR